MKNFDFQVTKRFYFYEPMNVFHSEGKMRFINPFQLNELCQYNELEVKLGDMNYYFFTLPKLHETCSPSKQLKFFRCATSEYCLGENMSGVEKKPLSKLECFLTDLFPW